jgi:hypothetical protein
MNKSTVIKNRLWLGYAKAHGVVAYVESGRGESEELGVVLEIPYWNIWTKEEGVERVWCQSFRDVRNALGY